LQGEKFLVVSEEANPLLYLQTVSICRAHHLAPTISNRLDTVKAVLLSVSAGLGVTILPDSLPRTILPELVSILPITDMDTALSYGIAWKKELLNPAAVLFLEVLREILPQKNHHD
jgi:DNA-binding transcriptional LysR family regulator